MIEFNKTLKRTHRGVVAKEPSIVFRKLAPLGKKDRYQATLNKKAIELAKKINPLFEGFQIMYSDEHLIIGLKPIGSNSKFNKYAGMTELMDLFDIEIGKHYKIKSNDKVIYFNSAQKDFNND